MGQIIMMKNFLKTNRTAIFSVICILLLIYPAYERWIRIGPLHIYRQVEDQYVFINQDGKEVSVKDLRGKVTVMDFIFTTCAGPCSEMTEKMKELQDAFQKEDNIQFVTVTVNPDYDSPKVLKKYGEEYGANFERWSFWTGSMEAIENLMKDQCVLSLGEDIVTHSTKFVLFDHLGRIRGYFEGKNEEQEKRSFKEVLQDYFQGKQGTGVRTLKKHMRFLGKNLWA